MSRWVVLVKWRINDEGKAGLLKEKGVDALARKACKCLTELADSHASEQLRYRADYFKPQSWVPWGYVSSLIYVHQHFLPHCEVHSPPQTSFSEVYTFTA